MIVSVQNGIAVCRCNLPGCGREFEAPLPEGDGYLENGYRSILETLNCAVCVERIEAADRERERAARERRLPEILAAAGVPERFRELDEVPNKPLAEWIRQNRSRHLVIGGKSGRGKTTSICANLRKLAIAGKMVKYRTARQLFAEYAGAKKSDLGAEAWLERLFGGAVLVVDELIGKAKLTETGAECLWEVIDRMYNASRPAIWLAGQFSPGSLAGLFPDGETADAVSRRLAEAGIFNTDGADEKRGEK